jgi:ribonucleoside-diphosphate reductase alpha chain
MNLQKVSQDIYERKYQLKNFEGVPLDICIDDTFSRVAKALASCEKQELQREYYDSFLYALCNGAIPAGRIMSNASAGSNKINTSLINCTVSNNIEDSIKGIMSNLAEAGVTLSSGAGIGYCFSTLRPKGSFIGGLGAYTSGPLSFMNIYDAMCKTISSAGGRRGAQMATFHCFHPDIEDFIKAKRENKKFRQFNLSVLITDKFMEALKNGEDWPLYFPFNPKESQNGLRIFWSEWPGIQGKVICKVYKTIQARDLWDLIMLSNYDYAEPGVLFIDRINKENPLSFCESITATNPCGEQPLPAYGACLLGSINLTRFVLYPFTDKAVFDFKHFVKVVKIFTRMLDNVVEINGLPLLHQRKEIESKRRHGMGILGFGSVVTMMKMRYGDEKSVQLISDICEKLVIEGFNEGIKLAIEKGPCEVLKEKENRHKFVSSAYIQRLNTIDKTIIPNLLQHGSRFTHHSSIAPTGTIALSFGNNASNGIEPSFSHVYTRNIIKEDSKIKENVEVKSYESLLYEEMTRSKDLPDYFISSSSLSPKCHIDIQAAAQKWIDSSISKTINVPTNITFEDFKEIYEYAYEKGLKGCTTFRYNPEHFQGVLVTKKDLASTTYRFTLENGNQVNVRGDEIVDYKDEKQTASNLYEALKENNL